MGGRWFQHGNNIHIDYVTIASEGNATDFGDLTLPRNYQSNCIK